MSRMSDHADEWAEEACAELDQQHAELQADWSQTIAAGLPDTLHQTFRAELAEIIAKLAETVVVGWELMPSDDAGVQLTGGPVVDETARIQHCLQQPDHPIVMQLQAGDAALSDQCWLGQCGKLASIDGTGQQLGLLIKASVIDGSQLLVEQRQVVEATPNTEVVSVIRAGLGAQDTIGVLVAADVLLGE